MVTLILTVSWVWCVGFVIADATGITSGFYEGFIYFIIYLFFFYAGFKHQHFAIFI